MIDLMTLRDYCKLCSDCCTCPCERICGAIVDSKLELTMLAAELDRKPMEDIDPEIVRKADLALKTLFQAMGGVRG